MKLQEIKQDLVYHLIRSDALRIRYKKKWLIQQMGTAICEERKLNEQMEHLGRERQRDPL